jgi:hypothetical protein
MVVVIKLIEKIEFPIADHMGWLNLLKRGKFCLGKYEIWLNSCYGNEPKAANCYFEIVESKRIMEIYRKLLKIDYKNTRID